MKNKLVFLLGVFFITFVGRAFFPAPGQTVKITVPAGSAWTDTGLDVEEGEEVGFSARGTISLQSGNPEAFCGPQGLELFTVQQPLRDKNLGALIGRVYRLISVEKDKETGEEIRHELAELFYIGPESRVLMPLQGRLQLGINENLVGDNVGEFVVLVQRDREKD